MNYLWIVYWILIFISLIFSIFYMFKKHKVRGICQFVLSLVVPVITLLLTLENEFNKSEIIYLLDEAVEGNTLAAMIIILYAVIIILFIYNLLSLRNKKNKEEDNKEEKKKK